MGNKQTSALTDKCNAEEKVDKSSQPTHKKDPAGRIEMFAVPMKITPTKPLTKATPKRITLTPVPVASNPTNQVTVQQVTSTAPDTAKNTAFMPAQKQVNVGSSPVNAMENQITPRRVPLMPAINSQPKKNNTCGQVTPRRVPLTPVTLPHPAQVHCPLTDSNRDKILQRAKILPVVFPKSQHRLQVILEQKTKPFSVKPHLAVHRGG